MKVSWQVTGIRHDVYANAHRNNVETNKPAEQIGYYLHPDLFGQPESKIRFQAADCRCRCDIRPGHLDEIASRRMVVKSG